MDAAHLLDVVLAGAEADKDAVPDPPLGPESVRAAEVHVLALEEWLRSVAVRTGIVCAEGGGPVLEAAAALAVVDGTSRYSGWADATYPLVYVDELLALLVGVVEDAATSGLLHAVTGWGGRTRNRGARRA